MNKEANLIETIIDAKGVWKRYDAGKHKVDALRGLDLLVRRGEVVAIMGPSGCGKTTLLNCLSGLDVIDAGTIKIAGRDLKDLTDNQRTDFRAREMGFVFQTYNLLPVLTGVENVELPMLVGGVRPSV
ncbi:MAG: ATP-binding cassette domain-containing protein, partial [Chloroflexi bacterium]